MIDPNIFNNKIDFNGAKGFVFVGEKILCYRRDGKTTNLPFKIDLPGGGREGNESPFETFGREIKEEFGIDIEKENITYANTHQSIIEPWKVSYSLVAKLSSNFENKIIFGNEGVEYFLLTIEEYLKNDDVIERQQVRLQDYLSLL